MKFLQRGFTVIEIMIIISVIGILVTIAVNGWQQVDKSTKNKARETDARQWAGAFDVYKSRFGAWPILPGSSNMVSACLGAFTSTSNKCDQYTAGSGANVIDATATETQTVLTEVAKAGAAPTNTGGIISDGNRSVVGPFVYMHQGSPDANGTVTVNAAFIIFAEGTSCPTDFTDASTLSGSTYPSLNSMLTSLPNGVISCALQKTSTYNSN